MRKKIQQQFDTLRVDMNSSHMQVFQAILTAAGGPDKPVSYGEIAKNLESLFDKKYTKAYIYRRLNDLVEDGFIIVDTILTPRTYSFSETSVKNALETKRKEEHSSRLTKQEELTTKLNRLKAAKSQDLVLMLHNQLVGISSIEGSVMIEGIENVRSTIIREFADGAKEGDLVRVLGHSSTLAEGLEPGGVTELKLMQSGFRGVKVKGLMTPTGQDTLDLNLMIRHVGPMVEVFKEVIKTGNIELRFTREPIDTYRIVSLNEDKMLLYLTHAKESDMAALIHRKDNPGLVDDALRTFDELWETGIDVLEIVKQMLLVKEQES
ncbi:MAG: hypothetical protein E3J86_08970 [Candidatus Thorarchaeota archaeon]|nr:MAG: hypothetical protein E3J86_08970 [Candidatus Thorarchaeota archaeon]